MTEPATPAAARHLLGVVAAAGVVFGGLLVIAGSLLPWTISRNETLLEAGWQGGDGGWMPNDVGLMAMGVLVAGAAMVAGGLLTSRHPAWWKGTLVASVVAGVLGWGAFGRAGDLYGGFSHPPQFSFGEPLDVPGSGVWFILAGAVVGVVASVMRRPWGRAGRKVD